MRPTTFFVLIANFALTGGLPSLGGALADQVYKSVKIAEGTACYRLFNGTHQFGCHDNGKNAHGVVLTAKAVEDLEGIEECWRSRFVDYSGNYWILLPIDLLNENVVASVRNSSCVSGILLHDPEVRRSIEDEFALSHDAACPNDISSYYTRRDGVCPLEVNTGSMAPSGLRNIDWDIQIVYLQNTSSRELIEKCYDMFNVPQDGSSSVNYPFCGMSFSLFNSAAGSSEICYRRGLDNSRLLKLTIETTYTPLFCSPLMGFNLFAWPAPAVLGSKPGTQFKYMMIATRLDSFGVIPEVSPGEVSVLTSLISVLATARAIGSSIESFEAAAKQSSRYVMFAAFNGESFDYIGSSAIANRIVKRTFPFPILNITQVEPIDLDQIEVIIEPQQIGGAAGRRLYTHVDYDRYTKQKDRMDAVLSSLKSGAEARGATVAPVRKDSIVPPASWHSFARYNDDVQAIVLAPYEKTYAFKRYNSMLDRIDWTPETKTKVKEDIMSAANSMLYAAADFVKADVTRMEIDIEFVEVLFDCLIIADDFFTCDFLNKINANRINKSAESYSYFAKSTYVSVANNNPLSAFTHWLFIYALGTDKHTTNVKSKSSCSDLAEHQAVYSYDWQVNPTTGNHSCYRASIQFTQLQSPAFEIEGYDFANSTFSTWTESVYAIDGLNVYLVQDHKFDRVMLLIGLTTLLLSVFAIAHCDESTFIVDEGEVRAEEGEPL